MAAELAGASYHQADLADDGIGPRRWSRRCSSKHGRLDVLVNNAGQSIRIPHADLKAATPALWRRMLDVNLIAPFVLIAEAEAGAAARPRAASSISAPMPASRPKGVVDPLCRRRRRRCIT